MKILLTGSSKGIGYRIAQDLIKEGHQIVLHYNSNKLPLDKLKTKSSSNLFIVKADLSSEDEVKNLVEETIKKIGLPDSVINNAGIAESADITLDFNNWSSMFDKTIDVNLKAPSLIFKEIIKYKRSNKIKSRLRFINIASRAAFRGEQQDLSLIHI